MRHGRTCSRAGSGTPLSVLGPQPEETAPGLVAGHCGAGDWIACQITSNPYADSHAITLTDSDFAEDGLQRISYLRPGKLFTCHESLPVNTVGALDQAALQHARTAVIRIIQG
jgi:mRNA interferase MazF